MYFIVKDVVMDQVIDIFSTKVDAEDFLKESINSHVIWKDQILDIGYDSKNWIVEEVTNEDPIIGFSNSLF